MIYFPFEGHWSRIVYVMVVVMMAWVLMVVVAVAVGCNCIDFGDCGGGILKSN